MYSSLKIFGSITSKATKLSYSENTRILETKRYKSSSPDGHLQTGRTIRILREDISSFFYHSLTHEIYSQKIQFRDPFHIGSLRVTGRWSYMSMSFIVRGLLRIYYDEIFFTMVSFQQVRSSNSLQSEGDINKNNDTEEFVEIAVRWVFEATPRINLLLGLDYSTNRSFIEGVFIYHLDRETGLVKEHIVASVDPKPRSLVWVNWITSLLDGRRRGRESGLASIRVEIVKPKIEKRF
ncbi:hypothetical protein HK096_006495 [Nowakowskiella sp. JEL0078]|nr:hypothetical protein HK096_006495 [Nowakowskiella sp. JEL0078]